MDEFLDKITVDKLREKFGECIVKEGVNVSSPENRFLLFDLVGPAAWLYTTLEDKAPRVSEILSKAVQRSPGTAPCAHAISRGAILDTTEGWALIYMLDASPGSLSWRTFEDVGLMRAA